ncbi:hypothetical protein DICPUDRAFT_154261 [Dictyostelium purpureum]|uniref:Uncharacterized protein n=1 Tax=Dictyostelium purpureum TaxID=5786 RepID=F0ZQV9_DICPU|nr:uncharacterized protein DICPUDRAFT_154261 [Dictyostelium purpureum]EGC33677.1 hypothetical protein DICPUDRAFT_154261 [Dictyostelium purpureum]|eukprot:XP_003289796.1 hypothetical protein DICPUDRAFT_154261 [Dictyostelium purpureum]
MVERKVCNNTATSDLLKDPNNKETQNELNKALRLIKEQKEKQQIEKENLEKEKEKEKLEKEKFEKERKEKEKKSN